MPAFFVLLLLYLLMPVYQAFKWKQSNHVINWFDVLWLTIYIVCAGTALRYISIYLEIKR